jgi:transcriptional regulator with XRE-family HTH domain
MSVVNTCMFPAGPMPSSMGVAGHRRKPLAAVLPPVRASATERPLQRLGEVRQHEDLSRREVAQRLDISVEAAERQEQPSSVMLLSDLYRWQEALAVPIAELLCEPDGTLSPPVHLRAHLVRIMKTVRSIEERARQASVQRLATVLIDELLALMPELEDTVAWPAIGRKRSQDELGQAYFRRISLDPLDELERPG